MARLRVGDRWARATWAGSRCALVCGADPALGTEPPSLIRGLARRTEIECIDDHPVATRIEPGPGGQLADRERRGSFVLDVLRAVVPVGGRRPERDVQGDTVVKE